MYERGLSYVVSLYHLIPMERSKHARRRTSYTILCMLDRDLPEEHAIRYLYHLIPMERSKHTGEGHEGILSPSCKRDAAIEWDGSIILIMYMTYMYHLIPDASVSSMSTSVRGLSYLSLYHLIPMEIGEHAEERGISYVVSPYHVYLICCMGASVRDIIYYPLYAVRGST
jgi:hypothetical protein